MVYSKREDLASQDAQKDFINSSVKTMKGGSLLTEKKILVINFIWLREKQQTTKIESDILYWRHLTFNPNQLEETDLNWHFPRR